MKLNVIRIANKLVHKNTDNDAYKLSMPLIAASIVDIDLYKKINKKMEASLQTISSPDMRAWMLGRMLLAAKTANFRTNADDYQKRLIGLLAESEINQKNMMTGWAYGYLAAYDADSYRQFRQKLIEATDYASEAYQGKPDQSNLTNLMWTLGMNIHAAASSRNKEDYVQFIQQVTSLTNKSSIEEAVNAMPISDFPAWLTSFLLVSSSKMNDIENTERLTTLLNTRIEAAKVKNQEADVMLAEANQELLEKSPMQQDLSTHTNMLRSAHN